MKTKLLLLFITISVAATAQTYHPTLRDSVEWKINYTGAFGAGSFTVHTAGDTVVSGVTYKKVKESSHTTLYREDTIGRKIYIRRTAAQTDLLYDYSLNLNDSIAINLFDPIISMTWHLQEFKVDSVSQTPILSGTRKFMRLHATQSPSNVLYWLESVGNLYVLGPLDYVNTCPVDCGYDSLVCQQQNGIQTFQLSPGIACPGTVTTGIADITHGYAGLSIYPNPAHDVLHITSYHDIGDIMISDMIGRIVLSGTYHDTQAELDIHQLPMGMYIARVNGTSYRFTKE